MSSISTVRGGPRGVVTDGLVLWLDASYPQSYPGFGTSWNDLSINRNIGSLINGPTFSSANGGSIQFDGVDDYVSIPTISLTADFSILLWENLTGVISNNQGALGFNLSAANDINHFGGKIRIFTPLAYPYTPDGSGDVIYSTTSTIAGRWENWTFTRIGGDFKLYYNGILDAVSAYSYPIFTFTYNTIAAGYTGTRLRGKISNFIIYNRALSAQEILQNYNATKTRFGL